MTDATIAQTEPVLVAIDIANGPYCTNRGLTTVPLSPDGLILQPQ